MAAKARSPGWRDEAAAGLLLGQVGRARPPGPILVVGESRGEVGVRLSELGLEVVGWNRRALYGRRASPWPPDGPFGSVALRLPRAKEELAMTLHAAAASLEPGGVLLVYGAKDEGIGSLPGRMGPPFGQVETIAVGGHCRVVRAVSIGDAGDHRSGLHDWRHVGKLAHGGFAGEWVSYPGIFAHGHLDAGTRLLLDAIPPLREDARILDYGCGSGIVAAMVAHTYPTVRLDVLDVDTVALEAARENVPQARRLLCDGLPPRDEEGYDAVLSNPPFHRGKAEEPGMVLDLIQGAPSVLARGGGLVIVAQKRLAVERSFRDAFRRVSVRAENGAFRVWEGWDPR